MLLCIETFLTDSAAFKAALRRLYCRSSSSDDREKKLLIQRVLDDHSWPPVNHSTIATATDHEDNVSSNLPQTVLSSDISLYRR